MMSRVQIFNLQDRIGQVLVPTEDVVEMKGREKIGFRKTVFPGIHTCGNGFGMRKPGTWCVTRPRSAGLSARVQRTTPLTEEEINEVLQRVSSVGDKPKPKFTFEKGEKVKINEGPFSNFTGTVEDVNMERSTLKVMVTIFGRATPVELEFLQVEKV